jgi:hypothetical protein
MRPVGAANVFERSDKEDRRRRQRSWQRHLSV